uniref:Uncharacterized protein n=1 Tax=viral metagenome TaxID=1070528 RepID=A0A6C0LTH5_9ZZZZ
MSTSSMDPRFPRYPVKYPEFVQIWEGTPVTPYPMNFVQAPSFANQVLVNYKGFPMLQGLSTVIGPVMFPVKNPITYPRSHSTLDVYNRNFLNNGLGFNYGYCTYEDGKRGRCGW